LFSADDRLFTDRHEGGSSGRAGEPRSNVLFLLFNLLEFKPSVEVSRDLLAPHPFHECTNFP